MNVLKALVLAFLLVCMLSTYLITAVTEASDFSVISVSLYVQLLPPLLKGCDAALQLSGNITLFSITDGYQVSLYRILHTDSLVSYRNQITDKAVKPLPSYAFSDRA
jgi:hypothetical protein